MLISEFPFPDILRHNDFMQVVLTPELLIEAYKQGLFPMAYSASSPYVHWICPEERGQLSIKDMHIPRSLKKTVRRNLRDPQIEVRLNTDFPAVIHACAAPDDKRPETWINDEIIKSYIGLHRKGYAHSVECWSAGKLVGGLYGIALGGAFFGESMFSRKTDASKIALVHLAARLWKGGFTLLDTQFSNPHLEQFGVVEIPHQTYINQLHTALAHAGDFALKGCDERALVTAYLDMREGTKPDQRHP